MKYKIINNSESPIGFENETQSLCGFAQDRLGFKNPPTVVFDGDNDNANKTLAKTGYYDSNTMEIHVYITGRHPKDILRSIAHELIHHDQNDKGILNKGGYSGPGYAQKNPHLRDMETQANDPMLFRDWEDSLKEKYPTIYNERRNRKMSFKDWKNKELNENLNKKWGFKMDLSKLSEGIGAGAADPMGGEVAWEQEPPMSNQELAIEDCVQQKVAQGMTPCEARPACEQEMGVNVPPEEPVGLQKDPEVPFQESSGMSGGAVQGHTGQKRRTR